MSIEPRGEVTRLLGQIAVGDRRAIDELCRIAYDDLRNAAQHLMRRERVGHTLQPTSLVNEAMLRLFDSNLFTETANRAIFYGAATRAMRQILVEHARRRNAAKRGGGWQRTPWDDAVEAFEKEHLDLEQLDAVLGKLERLHQRQYEVIQMRFFGGLTVAQISDLLEVSQSTVEKDLQRARTFLYGEMTDG